ncbi:MAG: HAMP domain-containing histidine kinase [Actinomycetota bacterium]|nr:HAMP domain-containing histidine kinase [Actinomycetota bacterium]MDQ6945418.1 HAMP domain-containing histidine kinase [Actinomycetota bacterium]
MIRPPNLRPPNLRPHSIRARLVATYTLVAMILAGAGLVLFWVLLRRGATASLDAALSARVKPAVLDVRSGAMARPSATGDGPLTLPGGAVGTDRSDARGTAPPPGANRVASTADAFTAVYRPDGQVASLEPGEVRASPLSPAQVRAASGGTHHLLVALGDEQVRVLAVPVRTPAGTWVVAAGTSLGPSTGATNEAVHQLEVAVPFLIVLAALSAWLLSGAALRPVERMRADADALGAHDPGSRLTVPATDDELASLAVTFNALLDRLQRSLDRQRDLIADAGHELRTPLSVLRIELDLADDPACSRADLMDSVAHARREVERLSTLADDLLFLARADSGGPLVRLDETDIVAVVSDSARGHRAGAAKGGIDLVADVAEHAITQADPAAVRRAVDNLVANALAATPPGGIVTVAVHSRPPGTTIAVVDTGTGFPEAFLAHAFERFARPDAARAPGAGGAGLGLAIVAEIVTAHHGTVSAVNNAGAGATVTIALPGGTVAAGQRPVGEGRTRPTPSPISAGSTRRR